RYLLDYDFAAILLDVKMPEIDGFETAALIRARKRSEHTPILFLTGFESEQHLFRGYGLGAVDFLFKPVVPEILRSKVTVFVELSKKAALLAEQAEQIRALNAGLEEQVQKRTAELHAAVLDAESARKAADLANEAKGRFLASMSHELRTPLNAVIGYSEMLEEEAVDRGATDFVPDLQKIRRAAGHLLQLIDNVLDLSKIEAGRMDLTLETFDVRTVVEDVVNTAYPLMQRNRNRLELRCEDPVGTLTSDLTKIRQCLLNLLSNAAKFTRDGLIQLIARRVDGKVLFEVRDNGIGMSAEQVARLFVPFTQVHSESGTGGTGLGLAITRRLCQLMGGEITLESEPGRGSCFVISLPAHTAEREAIPASV
ncbi:MAG: ATP-binding protein, partial [Acidobacteriota bacterium]|nr:ATP-binding protein [Acidobacteriota bacterium]